MKTQLEISRGSQSLGAGLTMVVVVALFALGGYWIDSKAGTSPLFLMIGFGLGAVGGFVHLVAHNAPELLPFGRHRPPKSEETEPPDSPG